MGLDTNYIKQFIAGFDARDDNDLKTMPIHFIVPFSGRPDNLERFLHYYETMLLAKGHQAHLVVVLFVTGEDDEGIPFVTNLLEKVRKQHTDKEFMLIKVSN